jgi:hypothetical protein
MPRRGAGWVKENIAVTADPTTIAEGKTALHF